MEIKKIDTNSEVIVQPKPVEPSVLQTILDVAYYALTVFVGLHAQPARFTLVGKGTVDHKAVCYGNGIWTSYEKAVDDAGYVSNLIGDRQVHLIYNPDQPHKLVECGLYKAGMQNETTEKVAAYFKKLVEEDPDIQILWVYHSGSGLIGRNVLQLLTPEVQSHISTYGIAPADIINSPHIRDAGVVISPIDLVPLTGANGIYPHRDKVEFVEMQGFDPMKEHEFRNPAYKPFLEKRLNDFLI